VLLVSESRGAEPTNSSRLDRRLGKLKDLNGDFPFLPPKTKEEWAARRERVIEQLLVANGLWPMPGKCDLQPQLTAKLDCGTHTIENVAIQSLPGHAVTGNLYRPNGKQHTGPRPAVLFAHGHWDNGRFHIVSDATAKAMVERGEEANVEQAKYFMQALPITLAKLGFVVFQYDMVGYAESVAIPHIRKSGVPHPQGFADAEAILRLHSLMGLQTWNSLRSLDYLCSLPDVDVSKIGMTGASGGGTQTFILAALDARIQAAAPAVMVSTGMQGGCVCENCSLLRVNTGNVELAALIAPRPLLLTGANDWTINILSKGHPELKQLYRMLGREGNLTAKVWPKLPHNFGRPSREFVYEFFLKHLTSSTESYAEPSFTPQPVEKLRVFTEKQSREIHTVNSAQLRRELQRRDDEVLKSPVIGRAVVLRTALRVMVNTTVPTRVALRTGTVDSQLGDVTVRRAVCGRIDDETAVPQTGVFTGKMPGRVLVWLHPDGGASLFDKDQLAPAVKQLVDAGVAVVAPDLLGLGTQKLPKGYPVNELDAGFTYGYNRSLLAQQVHDALTAVGFARTMKPTEIQLIGWGACGPVAILAKALADEAVGKLVADRNGLDFGSIVRANDVRMLPGALKYGGLDAFAELCDKAVSLIVNADGKKELDAAEAIEFLRTSR